MDPEERFYSRNSVNINLFIVAGALLVLYQYRYGLGVINPVNDNWLMKHDWATHYLGWFFYRNEPWVFPIGNISNYLYPVGTNIGFTDSIPLAAIFFKVFSPILPHHFQYIGLWLFGCHLLLAFFTTKLFEQFSVKGLAQLFAALIVVLNPVLLYRSIHPALCSHWIIVGCLWVYFLDPAKYTPTRIIIYQGIFFIAGALINPYLSLIGAGFFVATAWRLWYFDKSVKFTKVLGLSALTFSIVAILWFVIGFFSFKTRTDLGVTGAYGLYAFNLNSLFNSSGWSAFFGQRPMVSWHQYESFMYLGVGMIALIIVVLLLSLWRRFHPGITSDEKKSQARINLTPLSVFVIFISLFAITHVVTFDDKVLLTVHLNSRVLKVFDIFRASARYFWVFYYVLIIFVLIHSVRLIRHSIFAIGVLVLVLGVQLYDYRSLLGTEKLPHFGRYKVPLSESKWKGLFEKLDKFEFYPPMQTDYVTPGDYMYFSYLAADYAKPINLGYAARLDNKSVAEYTADIRERINLGDVGENELFISTRENLERFIVPYQQRKLRIGELDGYYFLFPAKMIGDPAFAQFSDAAPEEIKIRRTFTECQAPSAHAERNWRMQVHTLERSKSAIFLRASMPKDSTIGKSDFFVLLLSRDNKAFVSPPVVFSEDSVLGTGFLQFQGTYFTEGLKPGNYRVALMTESSVAKARNETFCYFGNLNVELKEVYKPYEAPDVGKMKWWLESIDASNEIITIGGWAFLSGQSSFPNRVELLFRSESKTYAVPTDPVLRPDVTTFFNNPFNIGTCGFISRIDKSLLESGKYEIGIRIVNDASGMDVIDYTNREFTVQ